MPSAAEIPLAMLLVFAAAKLLAEIFERLGQPGIVGEILAGVLIGQPGDANFERRRADRVGHDDADLAHRFQFAGRAAEVDEHHGASLVMHAGQVVALVRRLPQKTQRHGGANPRSRHRRQAHGAYAARVVYAQVEALRRTEAQFQYQELERAPIGGQAGVEVFQRPGVLRAGLEPP